MLFCRPLTFSRLTFFKKDFLEYHQNVNFNILVDPDPERRFDWPDLGPNCITPDRRQLKMLLTIDEHGSKIVRSRVFDSHLSPDWRQMAIENSVSNNFIYVHR